MSTNLLQPVDDFRYFSLAIRVHVFIIHEVFDRLQRITLLYKLHPSQPDDKENALIGASKTSNRKL